MTNGIFAASYERGVKLMAAGCPLDYPNALVRRLTASRQPFRVEQLVGYGAESCAYALRSGQTGYVIGLRLGTNVPGTVITKCDIVPPWKDHQVDWDYEPADIIPKGHLAAYRDVLDSRLMAVLKDRRLLRRGYPIDGLVCGCAWQPIPESCADEVSANLVLVDDSGNTVDLRIRLAVFRSAAIRSNALPKAYSETLRRTQEPAFRTGGRRIAGVTMPENQALVARLQSRANCSPR